MKDKERKGEGDWEEAEELVNFVEAALRIILYYLIVKSDHIEDPINSSYNAPLLIIEISH